MEKAKMNIRIDKYFGICKRFQGLGFLFYTDDSKILNEKRYIFEMNIFWIKMWIMFSI